DIATEIGRKNGLNAQQIIELKERIISNIPENKYGEMVGNIQSRVATGGRNSTMQTFTDQSVLKGNIKATINDATNRTIRESADDLFRLTTDQYQKLAQELSADVGSRITPTNLAKRSITDRIKNFFSTRMLGSIARSIGCGALANIVGFYNYNKQLGVTAEEMSKKLNILPEGTLEKGKTYKMIIETRISGETEEEDGGLKAMLILVDNDKQRKEMGIALSEQKDKEINGIKLKWNTELNEKRPEERTLSEYYMTTDPAELRERLKNVGIEKTRIEIIMKMIGNSYTQQLVKKYTQETINVNEEPIREEIIVAITLTENPTEGELKRELEGQENKIKTQLEKLAKILEKNDSMNITREVSKEMYEEETKEKIFYTVTNGLKPLQISVRQ
ncbi:MAG: hypothetical protein PHP82_04175, partial [Candidatus ainarchaeum sp.]|nr:hypothetical protein [Candidatus ainarchaeum sp.]